MARLKLESLKRERKEITAILDSIRTPRTVMAGMRERKLTFVERVEAMGRMCVAIVDEWEFDAQDARGLHALLDEVGVGDTGRNEGCSCRGLLFTRVLEMAIDAVEANIEMRTEGTVRQSLMGKYIELCGSEERMQEVLGKF